MMKQQFLILFLVVSAPMLAQPKDWTLDACMRYAIEHNPARGKQLSQNEIYRIDRQESAARFLPTLSLGVNATLGVERTLVKDGVDYAYVDVNSLSNNYGVYSSLTLFNGFANLNRARIAKVNRLRGADELQDVEDMVAFETMELYFNVQYYLGTVRLAQEQLAESEKQLRQAKRMEEVGLKSPPDVAEIQAQEAQCRFDLVQQENLLRLEVIKLKEKMNFPLDSSLLVACCDTPVVAGRSLESAMEVYQQAHVSLPKIAALDKSLRAVELEYKLQRSQAMPSLTLQGGYTTDYARLLDGGEYDPYLQQLRDRLGYYVTASVSIPLFNRLGASSAIRRSKQQLRIARYEREETLRQIYSEIEQAVADVNGMVAQYEHAVKRTESMQAAHQVNLRKFEEGLINGIELNTSANRLLESKVEELYTALQYQLKQRLLEYYKGGRIVNSD